jgi:hypothetical protein
LRPTCALRKPSAHFVNFATCTLPKCASRAQNPTFAPYLRTSFSALESYSSFLWSFLLPVIAGLRPHNLCFANTQYYSFQINLIFSPHAGTGRESIVIETVVLQRDLFAPPLLALDRMYGTKPPKNYRVMHPVGRPDRALQRSGAACTRPYKIH